MRAWENLFLEGYTFGEEIGCGASGTVYTAKSIDTGRTYAAKTLAVEDTSIREICVLTQLKKHPNIMEFMESKLGRDGETQVLFVISDFCPLGNIGDYILKQQVDVVTKRHLAVQLADAVTFLHKNGIVHCDIKPQNVLLTVNEAHFVLKVVDLGLAKVLTGSENNVNSFSRPHMRYSVGMSSRFYLSPETYESLLNDQPCHYTPSVDIFSMGLLLWAMFDGLTPGTCQSDRYLAPFAGSETDPMPVAQAVTQGGIELKVMESEENEWCRNLVRRMLSRDPKERPGAELVLKILLRGYGDYRLSQGVVCVIVDDDDNPLHLEGYTFGEEIGHGASGTVYTAKSIDTGRTYAAKKLAVEDTSIREICVLTQLKKHPNIMEFMESKLGRDGETQVLFIISEFCPLGNIGDYILKQQVDVVTKRHLAVQLADAITFLHENGIVHCDIKPQNVLLTVNEAHFVLKVVDFGSAKVLGSENNVNSFSRPYMQYSVGTRFYLSPEIYQSLRNEQPCHYTPSVDIFSMGLLLWAMFDGLTPGTCQSDRYLAPFAGSETDPMPVAQAVTQGGIELKVMESEENEWCKNLVRRMLSRDPKERPGAELVLQILLRGYGDYRLSQGVVRVVVDDDDVHPACSSCSCTGTGPGCSTSSCRDK
ncbi:STK35 [Branchiostoma lanceolatum]|uniref:STK35 protein n=1 Tax=Branchiostoma lanceolatum TaxID=7740 RepID=A0A8K0A6U2_BRALA|nr:STK35 [Branchiostoma lanceolatum]